MGSELIYRGHDEAQPLSDSYSPKPPKRWLAVTRPIRYVLREQRLVFVLVGIAIATLVFTLSDRRPLYPIPNSHFLSESTRLTHQVSYQSHGGFRVRFRIARLWREDSSGAETEGVEDCGDGWGRVRWESPRGPSDREGGQCDRGVHKTNVVGTLNMLGLAKRVGARFLLTSTSEVYGDPLQHPQVETYWGNVNPIGVRSCYDEGKRTAETLTMDYHRGAAVEVRIARIFNTYGPRMCIDDDGRVVSNFVAQVTIFDL
ncbi:NAD(P)-binding Rossmann-fold superfamily protein [Actinidia rufa]|uniref:UDP-glucuronate decarboxylase n=1 Tax=Actinidia rufa TaxID=165716 RepID=A0A7J0FJ50_9ERIC|nr:NAD(P)-binding Rossmann-fold superfamily protein [Actinidia rufa]